MRARGLDAIILRTVCVAIVLLGATPLVGQVISAHGVWAALRFGVQCEARSRAVGVQRRQSPAIAGFIFSSAAGRQGQFYTRLSRAPRPGATAILTVGGEVFLLDLHGRWAWARDARQDAAIMAAARYAGLMRLQSRDGDGRRLSDGYSLAGAATAIDAAAATCAQAGKSR